MQNGVQIHVQPLLISERDNVRLCLNWGFFSSQWKLRPVFLQAPVEPGETWKNGRGTSHPHQRSWVIKSARRSTDSTSPISCFCRQSRPSFGEYSEILSTLRLKSLLACKQLSWHRKVWVYTSQWNISESCLLSASCGVFCYSTLELIFHIQGTLLSYSEGLTGKLCWVSLK